MLPMVLKLQLLLTRVMEEYLLIYGLHQKNQSSAAPEPEVVGEIPDDSQMVIDPRIVAESNAKIEEVPKKSYASIVSGYHAVLFSHFFCKLILFFNIIVACW